jgi:hypothetical protein
VGGEGSVVGVRVAEDVRCTLGPAAADDVVGSAKPDGVELESFG